MKKWIAFLLAALCLLSLCACGKDDKVDDNQTAPEDSKPQWGNIGYVTVYLPAEKSHFNGISYTYNYDENGNMTEQFNWKNNAIVLRYTYTYDEKGRMTEAITSKDGIIMSHTYYTYDEEKNTCTECNYNADNVLEWAVISYLDEQNHVYLWEVYYGVTADQLDATAPAYWFTQTYVGDNRVEVSEYHAGDLLKGQSFYSYNSHGDVTKCTTYRYNNQQVDRNEIVYEYIYDENGNIMQCKAYVDGEYNSSSSYTCTYKQIKMRRDLAEKYGYI